MRFERSANTDRRTGSGRSVVFSISALAILACASPVLTGCTPTVETHGHSLEEEQLAKIEPGTMSRQEVLQIMGSPSALSAFEDSVWYYVSQRTEKRSFYQKSVVDQEVVTIAFDEAGRVVSVDRHGLEQVAAIDPVDRVTPTAGSSPSIFKQLISNIGRFSGAAGTDPDG